jgi:16S rRNA (guanine1207-N2)-methyltransferase
METEASVWGSIRDRIRSPVVIILGAPTEAARLTAAVHPAEVVCYQMDLHQADQLQEKLAQLTAKARVVTAPDLWDLPADFQTAIYPAPRSGERALKLDMVEQAFHLLRPRGNLVVHSPHAADEFFPGALKKIFGRVHASPIEKGKFFWCRREGERPRRRHEVTFQMRFEEGLSLRFQSRPGVFAYGRLDEGARALIETMQVNPRDRILDVGCGCGSNGICAARRSGPGGHVAFVDSNVRAVALAKINAQNNGMVSFEAVASSGVEGLAEATFDVALANPPYYAQNRIAQLFAERSRALLRPGGRLYLVTKQPNQIGPLVADIFGRTEVVTRRGYAVLCAANEERD